MNEIEQPPVFEWKISTKEPFWVLDWQGQWKGPWKSIEEARQYVERDKRMVHSAALDARADANQQIMKAFGVTDGDDVVAEPKAGNRKERRRRKKMHDGQ